MIVEDRLKLGRAVMCGEFFVRLDREAETPRHVRHPCALQRQLADFAFGHGSS